jgi:uncharacterized protein YjaG (DUF416 family)
MRNSDMTNSVLHAGISSGHLQHLVQLARSFIATSALEPDSVTGPIISKEAASECRRVMKKADLDWRAMRLPGRSQSSQSGPTFQCSFDRWPLPAQ